MGCGGVLLLAPWHHNEYFVGWQIGNKPQNLARRVMSGSRADIIGLSGQIKTVHDDISGRPESDRLRDSMSLVLRRCATSRIADSGKVGRAQSIEVVGGNDCDRFELWNITEFAGE